MKTKDLTFCSKVADDYYNHTDYQEGSGTQFVVDVIEELCKAGEILVPIDRVASLVAKDRPEFEKRVKHVISSSKNKGVIKKSGNSIEILVVDQ